MIDWIVEADLRRRTQAGLNKGEAHYALKRAVSFQRRGEIRDRTKASITASRASTSSPP
jgi:TnpA family transposase